MKLAFRIVVPLVLAAALALPAAALGAGRPALSATPRLVQLKASNCCAVTDATIANVGSQIVYLRSVQVSGDGWNGDFGSPDQSCYPYVPLPPGDSCTQVLDFGPFAGPGLYFGALTVDYSLHQDLSTLDGSLIVRLVGRGV